MTRSSAGEHEAESVLDDAMPWVLIRELAVELRDRLQTAEGDERVRLAREAARIGALEIAVLEDRGAVACRELLAAISRALEVNA